MPRGHFANPTVSKALKSPAETLKPSPGPGQCEVGHRPSPAAPQRTSHSPGCRFPAACERYRHPPSGDRAGAAEKAPVLPRRKFRSPGPRPRVPQCHQPCPGHALSLHAQQDDVAAHPGHRKEWPQVPPRATGPARAPARAPQDHDGSALEVQSRVSGRGRMPTGKRGLQGGTSGPGASGCRTCVRRRSHHPEPVKPTVGTSHCQEKNFNFLLTRN